MEGCGALRAVLFRFISRDGITRACGARHTTLPLPEGERVGERVMRARPIATPLTSVPQAGERRIVHAGRPFNPSAYRGGMVSRRRTL